MFENMSAIILAQNSRNFYLFCYFGIGSDYFSFHIKNYILLEFSTQISLKNWY